MDTTGIFRKNESEFYNNTTSENSVSELRSSSTLALPSIKSKPNPNWKEFLKSIKESGNYHQPSRTLSINLQETLNKAQNLSFDSKFRAKPKHLDTYLLLKKKRLNELKCENEISKTKLENLKATLRDLEESTSSEFEYLKEVLEFRYSEIHDISQGISNELYYQENLRHMQKIRKENCMKEKQSIENLQEENKLIEAKVSEAQKRNIRFHEAVIELKKEVKVEKKKQKEEQNLYEFQIRYLINEFNQACKIYESVNIENSCSFSKSQTKINTKDIIYVQNILMSLQTVEVFEGEKTNLKKRKEKCKLKIKNIKEETNIANIKLIVPYYKYLEENKNLLDQQVEESIFEIEERKIELKEAEETLLRLYYSILKEADTPKVLPSVLESRFLDFKELRNLENLVLVSTNLFNKVYMQIFPDSFRREVLGMDLGYLLSLCLYKLEKYMDTISFEKYCGMEESINTNIEYQISPGFLNLIVPMNKVLNIQDETESDDLETREI